MTAERDVCRACCLEDASYGNDMNAYDYQQRYERKRTDAAAAWRVKVVPEMHVLGLDRLC